jgi:hypothetical protein
MTLILWHEIEGGEHCVRLGEVIRELGRYGPGYSPAGIQLCRRKWKLEALLRQLDGPEEPPPVLEMVPRRDHATLTQVAA